MPIFRFGATAFLRNFFGGGTAVGFAAAFFLPAGARFTFFFFVALAAAAAVLPLAAFFGFATFFFVAFALTGRLAFRAATLRGASIQERNEKDMLSTSQLPRYAGRRRGKGARDGPPRKTITVAEYQFPAREARNPLARQADFLPRT
ncbi:MAG TPA: hypothetical protein VMF30_05005 [Pirellulales bacterium]|nr:hypothetical protein [Pirellulales bacterium]